MRTDNEEKPKGIAFHECQKIWGRNPKIDCFVSLGTGKPLFKKQKGIKDFVLSVIESATDVTVVSDLLEDFLGPEVFFRLNPSGDEFDVMLNETRPEKLDIMKTASQKYLDLNYETLDRLSVLLSPSTFHTIPPFLPPSPPSSPSLDPSDPETSSSSSSSVPETTLEKGVDVAKALPVPPKPAGQGTSLPPLPQRPSGQDIQHDQGHANEIHKLPPLPQRPKSEYNSDPVDHFHRSSLSFTPGEVGQIPGPDWDSHPRSVHPHHLPPLPAHHPLPPPPSYAAPPPPPTSVPHSQSFPAADGRQNCNANKFKPLPHPPQ